jgi:hypothetical protein
VNPSPRNIEAAAQPHMGARSFHIRTYSSVATSSVPAPSRYDARRPQVSATAPVGTSNSTCPAVKKALAANAWALLSPASSRNSVLIPQMVDAASVRQQGQRPSRSALDPGRRPPSCCSVVARPSIMSIAGCATAAAAVLTRDIEVAWGPTTRQTHQ